MKQQDNTMKDPHPPEWVIVRNVWDLPQEYLEKAKISSTGAEERYMTKKTFGFEKLLTKYKAMRERQIAENKGGNYNSHNLKGIIAKLRNTVICTKGMTQPGGVEKWIKMYPKVTARKSIVNMLNELKVFMNQFKGVIANL